MTSNTLTQSSLKELLYYNQYSGNFVWKVSPTNSVKIGAVAGNIQKCVSKYYRSIGINGRQYLSHRLAWLYMTGEFPKYEIDHINGDGLDNRFFNLRDVRHEDNQRNLRLPVSNTSGCIGVYLDKARNKWVAEIIYAGMKKHLGRYVNKEDAIKARKLAETKNGFHCNHGTIRPL